jgi:hypothetical protein
MPEAPEYVLDYLLEWLLAEEWERRDLHGHSEDAIYGACAEELRKVMGS